MGWQSGISSLVFFAAMMPAIRAAASTSPFFAVPPTMAPKASAERTIVASAVASRAVASLAETSTIRAAPASSDG